MNSSKSKMRLHFPSIVRIPERELKELISFLDNYYDEWEIIKNDKTTGLPKTYKDGTVKKRYIRPSFLKLKTLQNNIKINILEKISLPSNVHGGVKKNNNITNAKKHQGKKYVLTTDLQEFFPSVKSPMVYQTFIDLGFNEQFAFYITRFVTWKGELPQGTPTSTHIANIVFLKIDNQLITFCRQYDITYTRFVDDLTFSSQQDFHHVISDILEIVKSCGFRLSMRKTKYSGNQIITGIKVFNHKIDAPEKIIEKVEIEKQLPDEMPKYLTRYREQILKTNRKRS
ncbi:reverse transcriptase family protein [Chryseobacterium fluminis]|uniref:reverse transcriptase family protein n=1 Tax=Chryseobacterium fluminis TaxID=2983606 RepID=UPI0022556F58|nr:reverse transcriptase family protein [Chryseobacterium sp. MMS21-Ot14]UZU00097.1 reverse transcriptase family protein [Chryseobacterium sp. MMS21-Ot14]